MGVGWLGQVHGLYGALPRAGVCCCRQSVVTQRKAGGEEQTETRHMPQQMQEHDLAEPWRRGGPGWLTAIIITVIIMLPGACCVPSIEAASVVQSAGGVQHRDGAVGEKSCTCQH
jgi:hypothetical protein